MGYEHPDYAYSLTEWGEPLYLPISQGWLLKRMIPNSPLMDGMGCYPFFCCSNWAGLATDLGALKTELVSVTMVLDPFGTYSIKQLEAVFTDHFGPFKPHLLAPGGQHPEQYVSAHHRYYASKAMQDITVEVCLEPLCYLNEWVALYQYLCQRHQIKGLQAFSPAAFVKHLNLPGMVMFVAKDRQDVVAAHLWLIQGNVAYSHLAASHERGYALMAAYALYWQALSYFSGQVEWIHLGAGSGLSAQEDGLWHFKKGWATESKMVYLGGKILQPEHYQILSAGQETGYFPAYRVGGI